MGARKSLRPRFETLEEKTALAAGVATAAADVMVPVSARSGTSIRLDGTADGTYTSKQLGSGGAMEYHLHASGTIAPVGQVRVTGSFEMPSIVRGGETLGTLKVVGASGKLTIILKGQGPIIASAPESAGPIILVDDFTYEITRGTRAYAHDRGTGMVQITTTPGTTTPTGPGIYNAMEARTTGSGRTVVTFETGPVPLT